MDFEWDEEKRQANIAKHGIDFVNATGIFEDETVTVEDTRTDYGEKRLISKGMFRGRVYVVIHTERNGVIRLISAWRGGRKDYEQYQAGISGRNP